MSKMWRPRFDAGVSDWFIMSSVVGSTPCAMTTWPAGAADAPRGTRSVRARATRVWRRVIERLLARLHPAERLGLPHPRERAADRGSGGETQPAHDILAPEERRCRLDRLLLLPAAEEVAEQRRPPPDAER